jgi:hypothetical protein
MRQIGKLVASAALVVRLAKAIDLGGRRKAASLLTWRRRESGT